MSAISYLPGADIPAAQVLDAAKTEPPMATVLVVGKTQDGRLYFASTTDDAGEVTLLLGRAWRFLLDQTARECDDL